MVRKAHEESAQRSSLTGTIESTQGGALPEVARDSILEPTVQPPDHGDAALRPRTFDDYVGQKTLIDNLRVFVNAALRRGEALDHMLFAGPPGLGKTTLAHVIATELGVRLVATSGPAIEHKGVLAGLLTGLGERDVLFIDEIHRLTPIVEENLYPAMEDFKMDVFVGEGPHARAVTVPLARFTLLGATTRTGLLTAPLHNRFGFVAQLGYYSPSDLKQVVSRSARLLNTGISEEGALEIGRRCRGTPRIANRMLRRVRDFAEDKGRFGESAIDREMADYALRRLEVDARGLDGSDRALLRVVIERFDGGPVGIDAIAASMSEERDTIEDVIEPYLLQEGFLTRTPRGRVATSLAYQHLGLKLVEPKQGALL